MFDLLKTAKKKYDGTARWKRSAAWLLGSVIFVSLLALDEFTRNDMRQETLLMEDAPVQIEDRIAGTFDFRDVEMDAGTPYAIGTFRLRIPDSRVTTLRAPPVASIDFGVLVSELGASLKLTETFLPIRLHFDGSSYVGETNARLRLAPIRSALWSPYDIYQGGLQAVIRESSFLEPDETVSIDSMTLKFNTNWVVLDRRLETGQDALNDNFAGNHIFEVKRSLTDRIVPTVVLILLLGTVINVAFGVADVVDISKAIGVFLAALGARATLGSETTFASFADYLFLLLSFSLILLLTVNWGRDVLADETSVKCRYCKDPLNKDATVCKSCGRDQS